MTPEVQDSYTTEPGLLVWGIIFI